jgi:aminopeptidase N
MPKTLCLLLLLACGGKEPASSSPPSADDSAAPADPGQDIRSTHLALDLARLEGVATLDIRPALGSGEVWVDVSGLALQGLRLDGASVDHSPVDGILRVPVDGDAPVTLVVDYAFPGRPRGAYDGWMPDRGISFIWPDACANLFPCDPAMRDGVVFSMELTGVPEGKVAVYSTDTTTNSPAYLPAIAVGDFGELVVGTSEGGTEIRAYYENDADGPEEAAQGTAHLVDVMSYYERVYGPYRYGPVMGAVQVDWGDDYGGIETHPNYHVARWDFADEEVHAHEAAHAWFGDAVRIACWEDFVLSEGTVTYMAARAMEQVGGPDFWPYYVDDFLVPVCEGRDVNTIVLPETCNEIDFINDPLWSLATYMKGACFYEEVADQIGAERLDTVIAEFYATHAGGATEMEVMLDALAAEASPEEQAAIDAAAEAWLRSYDCPADYAARCRRHGNPP